MFESSTFSRSSRVLSTSWTEDMWTTPGSILFIKAGRSSSPEPNRIFNREDSAREPLNGASRLSGRNGSTTRVQRRDNLRADRRIDLRVGAAVKASPKGSPKREDVASFSFICEIDRKSTRLNSSHG